MKGASLALLAALFAGCSFLSFRDSAKDDLDADIEKSERSERESRTVTALSLLERSVNDYYQHEGKIPDKLDKLVPKYLAEIPQADTGIRGHGASSSVRYYPSTVIRDGVVDGTRLKDSGAWGYAFNDRRVIVFVDCTHPNSKQKPWYRQPGGSLR
ncbi:MAG: hypothetical protein HY925_04415 [Elusimicrobia bacterium]|nr:hypothetical protein [Elusimicrobiota bacterium]